MEIDFIEETKTVFNGDWSSVEAARLKKSYFDSISIDHKLPDWIRYMHGMSGKKYRYLINNYIGMTPNARYLEIGSWKGSTACAAIYNNDCKSLCIDNWSQFLWGLNKDEIKKVFNDNIQSAAKNINDVSIIDNDFRSIDYSSIGKYNIYMFDGPHEEIDQHDGIVLAKPALDDIYFLIVDDWNLTKVRNGTINALNEVNSQILCSIEITTRHDQQHPVISHERSDWHNGYFLAIIQN